MQEIHQDTKNNPIDSRKAVVLPVNKKLAKHFAAGLFASTALTGTAFAQCVVTTGTGTVVSPDPGDTITCTGTSTQNINTPSTGVSVSIDGSYTGTVALDGDNSTLLVLPGATIDQLGTGPTLDFGSGANVNINGIVNSPNTTALTGIEYSARPGNAISQNTVRMLNAASVRGHDVGLSFINGAAGSFARVLLDDSSQIIGEDTVTGVGVLGDGGNQIIDIRQSALLAGGQFAASLGGGDDEFQTSGTAFTVIGDIDGGAGNDLFEVGGLSANSTLSLTNQITNFEELRVFSASNSAVSFANATFDDATIFTNSSTSLSLDTSVTGTVTVSGDGLLQLTSNPGATAIDLQNNSDLELDASAGAFTLASGIAGAGDNALSVSGGTVTLTGANTYTGGTTITGGVLIGTDTNFGSGTINIASGGTLSSIDSNFFNNDITGDGVLEINNAGLSNFQGDMSGFIGQVNVTSIASTLFENDITTAATGIDIAAGGVIQFANVSAGNMTIAADITGAGVLGFFSTGGPVVYTLTGINTWAGNLIVRDQMTVTGAASAFGSGQIQLSDVTAIIDINEASMALLTNDIISSGSVIKSGAGDVTLTGSNTYTGGTTVSEGILRGGVGSFGTGVIDVASGATAEFQAASGSDIFTNAITGAGRLIVNASVGGSAVNTRVSAPIAIDTLEVEGGFVKATPTDLQALNVVIADGAVLDIDGLSPSSANIFAANLSGPSGGTFRSGFGTRNLSLTGDNTSFAGTILIDDGAVFDGALEAFNVGRLEGSGTTATVNLTGATGGAFSANIESLTLVSDVTGAIDFTGDFVNGLGTSINAGDFRVNTVDFATDVMVGINGRLGGGGIITGNVDIDGTAAPGNSIGTLSVTGDVVFNSGSTFEVEFDGTSIDLLDVTGTATINSGANLVFIPLASGAASGGTFLQASNGVTGTFDNVSVQGGGNMSVVYQANSVEIGTQGSGSGGGGNQGGGSGGGGAPVILSARPDHLSAEASLMSAFAFDVTDMVAGQMVRHAPDGKRRLWGGYLGGFADIDASGGVDAINLDHNGFVGGVDYPLSDDLSVGIALGWTGGTAEVDHAASKVSADSVFILATARTAISGVNLAGGVVYGDHDLDTGRDVSFNGVAERLERETNGSGLGAFIKARLPVADIAGSTVALTGGVDLWRGAIDQANDASSNALALTVEKKIVSGGRFEAGADIHRDIEIVGMSAKLYAEGGVRYTTAFDDRSFNAVFNNGVGPAVVLDGDEGDQLQAALGAGIEMDITEALRFYADYDSGISGAATDHAISTGVRMAF